MSVGLRTRTIRLVTTIVTFLAAFAACPYAEDWPRWRGPRLDGISRETGLLTEWPKSGPRQLWKINLSGGFSTVAVADGRVFTQTKEGNQEVVVCLEAATGKELWRYRYDADYDAHSTFTGEGKPEARSGPRATPAVDQDRVYVMGATGILAWPFQPDLGGSRRIAPDHFSHGHIGGGGCCARRKAALALSVEDKPRPQH